VKRFAVKECGFGLCGLGPIRYYLELGAGLGLHHGAMIRGGKRERSSWSLVGELRGYLFRQTTVECLVWREYNFLVPVRGVIRQMLLERWTGEGSYRWGVG